MNNVPVVFADAQATGAGVLREALEGRSEPFTAGATVGTKVPATRAPEAPHLPYVMVRKDADFPHASMANARVTLRVTVWHKRPDDAHDLAMLCQALLLVHSGPVIRSARPGTGPLAAIDPDSDVDLCSFTVLANVRPQRLTL